MSAGFLVSVELPDGSSRAIEVPDQRVLTIGRDPKCHVVLPSASVSRVHLRARHALRRVSIVDESSHGTFHQGKRLSRAQIHVSYGEPLGVGPYVVRIEPLHSTFGGEPTPPDVRRRIHRLLLDHLDLAALERSKMDADILRPRVIEALEKIIARLQPELPLRSDPEKLIVEMTDEVLGLGPLQELLDDDGVSEVMVVDPETIYVERQGKIALTPFRFTDEESCRAVIERIVTPLGRRIDESTPLVDARLEDGSRVNAVIPPIAVRGPCITIRKFARRPLEMSCLVQLGSLTRPMATFLQRCVRSKKNMIISGGTGSGKTTLLNVLSAEIPSDERIITIEDAAELSLAQPHVVALESKPSNLEGSGEYTIRDLVRNALRMRPDRIIVGECRAGEAIDMLQAMNTGHEGSMTTTHANSAEEAVKRIETLALMSGLDLTPKSIREQVAASIHVVIQQTRFSDGARRVTSITEVGRVAADGELVLHDIFAFHRLGTGGDGQVLGEHRTTGYVPSFLDDFITQGLVGDEEYL